MNCYRCGTVLRGENERAAGFCAQCRRVLAEEGPQGAYTCPICRRDTPHNHLCGTTPEATAIWEMVARVGDKAPDWVKQRLGFPVASAPALPDRETREAVERLDLVELPPVGSFDGSIAGGPPWSIDLFRPGPEFESGAEKVRENRRQRAAQRGPQGER